MSQRNTAWWKEGIVYQIYPRSFLDTTGTGVGDLNGITQKLDYLKELGVDIIWISPFFQSPQKDNGYDISDYTKPDDPYGTVADLENLIKQVHDRGMKILFDLVVNHTSDQHVWFQEARKSKTNPYRDYYIWKPATYVPLESEKDIKHTETGVVVKKDGKKFLRRPPSNWKGCFGGSVWEWDETTEEYYLHYFVPEQPDLNWENPNVRATIFNDIVNYWLSRGCDGYRIDTVNMYSKRLQYPDVPIVDELSPWQPADSMFVNGPRLHEFLHELNTECFSKYDCVTIGESPSIPIVAEKLLSIAPERKELDMVIQFDLMDLDHGRGKFRLIANPWKFGGPGSFVDLTVQNQSIYGSVLKNTVIGSGQYEGDGIEVVAGQYKDPMSAWPLMFLENHDQARSVSRFGDDSPEFRSISAKMLAVYLLTLSGSIILYQGQEIGMINLPKDYDISEYPDVGTINLWKEVEHTAELLRKNGKHDEAKLLEKNVWEGIQLTARDHSRNPMQWSAASHAGFSTNAGDVWQKVATSYMEGINVEEELKDPNSVLHFYQDIIKMRKEHKDIFVYGIFELISPTIEDGSRLLVYRKKSVDGSKQAIVAVNFGKTLVKVDESLLKDAKLLLGDSEEGTSIDAWGYRVWLV